VQQGGNQVKPASTIIKKYPNRRLYDTSSGRYVNLEDVAALIRQGAEVTVVDARTGKDVTRTVLTQIIADDAKDEPSGVPLELLRQLVLTTDRAGQDFMTWYLKSAVEAYQKVHETVQTRLTDVRSAALSPLEAVKNLLTPPTNGRSEVEELRRRVAELEGRSGTASRPRKRRPREKR
jgi:polyhydroxyalkanoate synthesis repressor PhaR